MTDDNSGRDERREEAEPLANTLGLLPKQVLSHLRASLGCLAGRKPGGEERRRRRPLVTISHSGWSGALALQGGLQLA